MTLQRWHRDGLMRSSITVPWTMMFTMLLARSAGVGGDGN
jgi:hypothetical protein